MADLTAHFRADFSDFSTAVQRAEVELRSFETGANKVEGSLTRMTDAFSGRKLIQDATVMVRAIEAIGGATKLTDAEMSRLTRTVTEATAKMVAMGMTVPPEFAKITTEATKMQRAFAEMDASRPMVRMTDALPGVTGKVAALSQGLGQVDRILGVMGTNIGPHVAALRELEVAVAAVGTGFSTMGIAAVGVGGLLLAWNTDWQKVHQTIADTTAKLLGWGDVAKETAAANAHILAEASDHAGRAITNMSEAMKINADAAKQMAEADRQAAEEATRVGDEFRRRWNADVQARNEVVRKANADLAKMYSDTANLTGQFQMDAAKAAMDQAKASAEANARGLDLMLLDFIKHEEALMAAAEQARQQEAAAAQAFFQTELGGGMKIIGAPLTPGASELERPQSLLTATPLNQRGVALFGGPAEGMPAAGPTINQTFNINGTAQDVARTVTEQINQTMSRFRKFGSS